MDGFSTGTDFTKSCLGSSNSFCCGPTHDLADVFLTVGGRWELGPLEALTCNGFLFKGGSFSLSFFWAPRPSFAVAGAHSLDDPRCWPLGLFGPAPVRGEGLGPGLVVSPLLSGLPLATPNSGLEAEAVGPPVLLPFDWSVAHVEAAPTAQAALGGEVPTDCPPPSSLAAFDAPYGLPRTSRRLAAGIPTPAPFKAIAKKASLRDGDASAAARSWTRFSKKKILAKSVRCEVRLEYAEANSLKEFVCSLP